MLVVKKLVAGFSILTSFFVMADDTCAKKNITLEVDSCYAKLKNDSEIRLNGEYIELKKRIAVNYSTDKEMAEIYLSKLLNAQRNWLKYRDQQCSMESLFADPSTQANLTLVNKCISRIDEQRVVEMKALPY